MYTDENKKIVELICREIMDDMTGPDREFLQSWIDESDANRNMYERLKSGESFDNFNRDFSDIQGQEIIDGVKRVVNRRHRHRVTAYVGAAASVLVLGLFIFNPFAGAETETLAVTVAEAFPSPGNPKAILSYSDQQIMLTEEEQGDEWEKHVNAAKDEEVQQIMVEIPRGGEYNLKLSDGTSVWLNSESKITYPNRFSDGERKVIIEGEAYFDVVKNEEQPFIVDVRGIEIYVTGTEFNVSAYDSRVETTLISGGVRVTADGNEAVLTPGMQAVYTESGGGISVREVDTSIYTAWKDGIFRFRSLELSEIVKRLGRWYDVEFRFEDPKIGNLPFTGAFKKTDSITSILDVIRNTKSVSYSIDGDTVILK